MKKSAALSLPVHPLQLYFGLAALTAALVALRVRRTQHYPGQVALVFLAVDGTAKFLLEFLRAEPAPHLRWLALGMGGAAMAGLLLMSVRRRAARLQEEPAARVG